jgi:ATP-dependent RNA helicase DeaD
MSHADNEAAQPETESGEIETGEIKTGENTTEPGFGELGLSAGLVATLDGFGYKTPTPIQAQTIGLLLEGRDVLGQAQTGTGKTAAFALPLLDRIDLSKKQPQVLVLAPTRELAIQVAESFEKYAKSKPGLQVFPIYGGQDYQVQLRPLKRGVHVVVGTPGRVMDHMRRGSLKLGELQCLVLDEADEMLRMGFAEDVEWVLTQIPGERQLALFSATMPKTIRQIAKNHLKNPAEVTIRQETATADTVHQRYLVARPHEKQAVLARILEAEPTDGVLVFVKTRNTTGNLADYLAAAGFRTAALSGELAQKQRERIVESLRAGKTDIIVATDIAARGLDVKRISHVINYDLPYDSEAYVHRIGRTGRAGRSGQAILLVHPRERRLLKRLEQDMRHTIEPMNLPTNRDINKQRVARFHEKITEGLASKDMETFQSIITQYQRENDVPIELVAASVAMLANADSPLIVKDRIKQVEFAGDNRREHSDDRSRKQKKYERTQPRSGSNRSDDNMQTYRIEVGRTHQVQPGNIVGAITNETGMGGNEIGKIKIFDRFSAVDLPKDMPSGMLESLKNLCVSGRKLRISQMEDSRPRPAEKPHKKSSYKKSNSSDQQSAGSKA